MCVFSHGFQTLSGSQPALKEGRVRYALCWPPPVGGLSVLWGQGQNARFWQPEVFPGLEVSTAANPPRGLVSKGFAFKENLTGHCPHALGGERGLQSLLSTLGLSTLLLKSWLRPFLPDSYFISWKLFPH